LINSKRRESLYFINYNCLKGREKLLQRFKVNEIERVSAGLEPTFVCIFLLFTYKFHSHRFLQAANHSIRLKSVISVSSHFFFQSVRSVKNIGDFDAKKLCAPYISHAQ